MSTRVLCRVHKTRCACPGLGHPALMMTMKCEKVAWCVTWIDRGSEVAWLFKIVNTCVRPYVHKSIWCGHPSLQDWEEAPFSFLVAVAIRHKVRAKMR